MKHQGSQPAARAITLLELLVVVLIISLLATLATGIYTGEAERARTTAARALVNQLEMAITRYEIDMGRYPPSGSGTLVPPGEELNPADRRDGSGYLHLALVHSLTGNANRPETLWNGPYISFQKEQLRGHDEEGNPNPPGMIDILDPWGRPIRYVRHADYPRVGTEFSGGTRLFHKAAPEGADPALPAPNPFVAMGETYYNPLSYQIISLGRDGMTLSIENGRNFTGAAEGDVNNFGY